MHRFKALFLPVPSFLKVTRGLSCYAQYFYSIKFPIRFTANSNTEGWNSPPPTFNSKINSPDSPAGLLPWNSDVGSTLSFGGQIFQSAKTVKPTQGFRWAQGASDTSEMAGFFRRAHSPAALMETNEVFLCMKKLPGQCCCFILEYKTEGDLFKGVSIYCLDWVSCLLWLTSCCQARSICFFP